MALNQTEQDIINKLTGLSAEGRAAAAKIVAFGSRFEWFYVAVAAVAGFALGHFLHF